MDNTFPYSSPAGERDPPSLTTKLESRASATHPTFGQDRFAGPYPGERYGYNSRGLHFLKTERIDDELVEEQQTDDEAGQIKN